jgi:hypothetical protein
VVADSNVPITAGAGTNVDTRTNTGGEHRQVVIIGDGQATSDLIAAFRPDSVLRVAADPTTLLVDSFDTLDTVNTWTVGGNNVPTQTAGKLTVSAATTASMQSTIRSMPAFVYRSPSYLQGAFLATLEAGAVTGNKRCWGFGTLPATSTVAIPLTNGVCFEIQDTDGALVGAAYSNSTRTQTVALTRPADGLEHRYAIYYKTSRVYFEIDNVIAGSIATPDPQIMTLPLTALSVNAASGQPGTAAVLTFSTLSVSDSGRNNQAISDSAFPWRQANVLAAGQLAVSQNPVRTQMAYGTVSAGLAAGTTATDAMIVLGQQFRAGVSQGTTGTSFAITANKTFRVTSMTVALLANAALVSSAVFTLRYNPAGAAVTGSAPSLVATLGVPAVSGQLVTANVPVPDGLDLPGGATPGQFGISVNPTWATTAPQVYAWLAGYEFLQG